MLLGADVLKYFVLRGPSARLSALREKAFPGTSLCHDNGLDVAVPIENHLIDGHHALADACAVQRVPVVNDEPLIGVRNVQHRVVTRTFGDRGIGLENLSCARKRANGAVALGIGNAVVRSPPVTL